MCPAGHIGLQYNNKDEDSSPNTLNDKNQVSSQKFRQQLEHVSYG